MKLWITWLIGVTFVVGFWTFSWQKIDQVPTLIFDEYHYIPAAKTYLSHNPILNTEHPPLGKFIISRGILALGDNPMGWRLMSTIFGALTLAGIFIWSFLLFNSLSTALFTTVLTVANNMLYAQSRIAMLDTFMAAFLIWAGLSFSYWWKHRKNHKGLFISALFFGLALATKWFALFPITMAGLFLLINAWKTKSLQSVFIFTLTTLFTYSICFYPFATHGSNSWMDFFNWQIDMWNQQQAVTTSHPYMSPWWSWPLQLRPIWYSYSTNADNTLFQGVALIGNPILLWGGILAVISCLWRVWEKKCAIAKEVLLIYLVCLLSWAIIPRKITFFYYYYPAVLTLSFVWASAWDGFRPLLKSHFELARWSFACIALWGFIYFLPILSGRPSPIHELGAWAWFTSWI